jgi:glycolate oxidase
MAFPRLFIDELTAILGRDKVWLDADRIEPYSRDESDTGIYPPDGVAFVETAKDVVEVFRLCTVHQVPVTPVAARTGKSGGSLPVHRGLALSVERMNAIREINTEDLVCVLQPGVITGDLMKAAEAKGLFYPPDPNSLEMCTIGGNVAENAGGPRALKYGVTREYVLGLEVVVPTGEILRVGKRTLKGVAGYDLTALIVGSEGTLGIVTEITLKLIPKPRCVATSLVVFDSVIRAAQAISAVLAAGVLPRTLELLDATAIRAVDGRGFRFPAGAKAACIVEVDGNAEESLFAEMARIGEICSAHGATETMVAQNEEQRRNLWAARRVVSTALRALKPRKISEDIAVPRSRIPDMVEALQRLGKKHDLVVATYGHAGDGNLHANILFDDESQRPRVDAAVAEMLQTAIAMKGTITGEHGVGIAKRDFITLEQGEELVALQKRLKKLFDPHGILNPGKIFPD